MVKIRVKQHEKTRKNGKKKGKNEPEISIEDGEDWAPLQQPGTRWRMVGDGDLRVLSGKKENEAEIRVICGFLEVRPKI